MTLEQVVLERKGGILEKPGDAKEARRYLRKYDVHHPGTAVSRVVLTEYMSGKSVVATNTAPLVLEKFPGVVIERHIEKRGVFGSCR